MKANSRRTSRNKAAYGALIAGVVLLALVFAVPTIVGGVASLVMTPFAKTKTWFAESSASLPQFFRDRQALIDENNQLRSELAAGSGNQVTLSALAEENRELRSLLGYEGEQRILAGIIGRPSQLPYDVVMLDQGQEAGIVKGAPVFVGDNTVIGIVRTVYDTSSLVELVTSPNFSSTVFILGPNIYTTAVGVGGGQMRVGVPQGINIEAGNLVVIPSVTSGVFGEVTHVESLPTRPEQYGFVSTDIPLASLRLVSVGSTPVSPVDFETAQAAVLEAQEDQLIVPVPEDMLIQLATSTATSSATTTNDGVATTTPAGQ